MPASISTARAAAAGTGAARRREAEAAFGKAEDISLSRWPKPKQPRASDGAATNLRQGAAPQAGSTTGPTASLWDASDAQREQRYRADTDDQDHQGDRVVVEPMSAVYTHDVPHPAKPTSQRPLLFRAHIGVREGFRLN